MSIRRINIDYQTVCSEIGSEKFVFLHGLGQKRTSTSRVQKMYRAVGTSVFQRRQQVLTFASASTIVDDMSLPKQIPDPGNTADALAAVLALRQMADELEASAVHLALRQGWSWSKIAEALGVSKQAAHRRLSHLQPK